MGPHVSTPLGGIEAQIMDVEGDSPRSGQLSIVDEGAPRVALSTSISVTTWQLGRQLGRRRAAASTYTVRAAEPFTLLLSSTGLARKTVRCWHLHPKCQL